MHYFAFFRTKFHRPSLAPLKYLIDVILHILQVQLIIFHHSRWVKIYATGYLVSHLYMYIIKSRGPRIDPCGTLLSLSHQRELCYPIITRCFLPIRKALPMQLTFPRNHRLSTYEASYGAKLYQMPSWSLYRGL